MSQNEEWVDPNGYKTYRKIINDITFSVNCFSTGLTCETNLNIMYDGFDTLYYNLGQFRGIDSLGEIDSISISVNAHPKKPTDTCRIIGLFHQRIRFIYRSASREMKGLVWQDLHFGGIINIVDSSRIEIGDIRWEYFGNIDPRKHIPMKKQKSSRYNN